MTEILLKIWIYWMPIALVILYVSEKEKYNPFNEKPTWVSMVAISVIWPVHYGFALFQKRRG